MNEPDRWRVDFYDFTAPPPETDDPDIARYGDVHQRAARNAARHGTPILTPPSGRPDSRINLFFRTGTMAVSGMLTWRRYAYTLAVWLDFLDAVGRSWDEATAGDVEAFKDWRLTDLRNHERIRATSFDTDRAGLNSFYTWASARYGIRNPVPTVPAGTRAAGVPSESAYRRRRDPLRPAASSRRQIKWLLRPALTQWRDVGLRGYGFDGLRRSGWRGFNEDRDIAFVDGLYGTGLRLREWSSVLDVELPRSQGRHLHRAWLAEQCIKGAKEGRYYWIPRRALQQVEAYMDPIEGSRAEVVARAQRRGLYERLHGLRIVVGHGARAGALYVEGRDGAVPIALDVLGPDERQLLYRRTPAGLEPLWVWLSINGLPKKPYSWEDTFAAANERVARAWAEAHRVVGGPEAEYGWEVRPCPLWATPHILRHSFALRWFSLLSLVEEKRVEGLSEPEAADLREQLGDLWLQLAVLMGHKRECYLTIRPR